ncbi:hypothetical protein DSAG12_01699 [Promethearchaeum syntrophicum]|uniref:Uncharacterized protein n=1 Tax=Promethearchaeum syntrophicum TaxID=2594042 RepID=A0A5B9D9U1_9ARCH|nr:hypothetical protein [Candidatus Prometheoarchaeum syntrophicum]QEE15872.1 hypothetical protein DSAG12_01699 [Candidatus Prometheoarchaeum syntrophicum]
MVKSKKNKKNKKKEMIGKVGNLVNDKKKDKESCNYTDEELSCKDITPEQCEHLRNRTFSNNPKKIFLEVRTIEERYKHSIEKEKDDIKNEIEEYKEKYGLKYKKALENKYKEINFYKTELTEEMTKNLEMLSSQEHMNLSEIDMIYKIKSKSLIQRGLEILGITF